MGRLNRPYKRENKELAEASKNLYEFEEEKGVGGKILSIYKTAKDCINLIFRPNKWIEDNPGLSEEEIIKTVDKCELIVNGLTGSIIAVSTFLAYDKDIYFKDKFAHILKGYLTALATGRVYRFIGRKRGWKEDNRKIYELGSATAGGLLWEYKDSITGGIVDPLDPVFDVYGGAIQSLITYNYQKIRSELIKSRR